jgi:hypothetical protein
MLEFPLMVAIGRKSRLHRPAVPELGRDGAAKVPGQRTPSARITRQPVDYQPKILYLRDRPGGQSFCGRILEAMSNQELLGALQPAIATLEAARQGAWVRFS